MRVLRKFLRWPYSIGALFFLRLALRYATTTPNPDLPTPPIPFGVFAALYVALAALFAAAWWTTRKPSNKPNWLAVAASSIFLVFSGFLLFLMLHFAHSGDGYQSMLLYNLLLLALAITGIVIYSRGIALGKTPTPASKPVRMEGDRTHPAIAKIVTGIAVVAQIASINLWAAYAHRHHFRYSAGLLYYALIIAAGLLSTTVHECAHTVVAWAFKMKLLSFETGPFRWSRKQGKWSFKFTPAKILSLGGAVGIVPSNKLQPNSHEIAVLAAGPLSNLLLGALTWSLALHAASSSHIFLWKLLALTTSTSLIAAVVNLFPLQIATGAYSDGARILQLLSASPVAELHKALLAIRSTTATPRRPRDLELDLLQRAADLSPDPIQTVVIRLAISGHYEDRGMIPEARAAFKAAELFCRGANLTSNPAFPVDLYTAFIIPSALLKQDPRSTRLWWCLFDAKKPTNFNTDYFLARACSLWMDNHFDDALLFLNKADTEAAKLPDAGSYNFDRDRCARIRKEVVTAQQAAAAQPARLLAALPDPTPSTINFRPSFLASTVSTPEAESAVTALLAAHTTPAPSSQTNTAGYPNERRRWPRNSTAPGRNMWPRPIEG